MGAGNSGFQQKARTGVRICLCLMLACLSSGVSLTVQACRREARSGVDFPPRPPAAFFVESGIQTGTSPSWEWNQARENLARPYFDAARRAERSGDIRLAAAEYRKGITFFPGAIDELGLLGLDLVRMHRCQEALQAWKQALVLSDLRTSNFPSFRRELREGDKLFAERRYRDAFGSYYGVFYGPRRTGVEINPEYHDSGAEIFFQQGLKVGSDGDYNDAVKQLRESTSRSPYFQEAFYFMGSASFAAGNISEAQSAWSKTLTYLRRSQIFHGPDEFQVSALRWLVANAACAGS